jgi:restriction endonuclease S subunit
MLDFAGSSGHQRVSSNFIEQLSIPLPPLAVQERIATEAHARRESAKALEREASEILAAAKAEVERMILG